MTINFKKNTHTAITKNSFKIKMISNKRETTTSKEQPTTVRRCKRCITRQHFVVAIQNKETNKTE